MTSTRLLHIVLSVALILMELIECLNAVSHM